MVADHQPQSYFMYGDDEDDDESRTGGTDDNASSTSNSRPERQGHSGGRANEEEEDDDDTVTAASDVAIIVPLMMTLVVVADGSPRTEDIFYMPQDWEIYNIFEDDEYEEDEDQELFAPYGDTDDDENTQEENTQEEEDDDPEFDRSNRTARTMAETVDVMDEESQSDRVGRLNRICRRRPCIDEGEDALSAMRSRQSDDFDDYDYEEDDSSESNNFAIEAATATAAGVGAATAQDRNRRQKQSRGQSTTTSSAKGVKSRRPWASLLHRPDSGDDGVSIVTKSSYKSHATSDDKSTRLVISFDSTDDGKGDADESVYSCSVELIAAPNTVAQRRVDYYRYDHQEDDESYNDDSSAPLPPNAIFLEAPRILARVLTFIRRIPDENVQMKLREALQRKVLLETLEQDIHVQQVLDRALFDKETTIALDSERFVPIATFVQQDPEEYARKVAAVVEGTNPKATPTTSRPTTQGITRSRSSRRQAENGRQRSSDTGQGSRHQTTARNKKRSKTGGRFFPWRASHPFLSPSTVSNQT